MKCQKLSLLALTAGALMAVSASAQAVPIGVKVEVISAMACVRTAGDTAEISTRGNVYNSSTVSPTTVLCPIMYHYYTASAEVTGVVVTITDRSSVANFSCKLIAVNSTGTAQTDGTAVGSTGNTGLATTLTLVPPVAYVGGSMMVNCAIPRKGTSDTASIFANYAVYMD